MAGDPYVQQDVSDWPRTGEEPDGLTEHSWFRRPDDDRLWLFKPVEVKDGKQQGEDWAEKSANEIGNLLGVPCAQTDLALRHGHAGIISRDIRPTHWDMQPGAVLLGGVVPDYESRTALREGHNLANIAKALTGVAAPPLRPELEGCSAYDVFCGYLVLDALVANSDRHDHNWGVLIPPKPDAPVRLAPSYDHASSLGFNLDDEARAKIMAEGRLPAWAARGRAQRFEHTRPASSVETLVSLAVRALETASELAQARWRRAVSELQYDDVREIVQRNPVMSEPAGNFAVELIRTNRSRLLAAWAIEEDWQ